MIVPRLSIPCKVVTVSAALPQQDGTKLGQHHARGRPSPQERRNPDAANRCQARKGCSGGFVGRMESR